jgi:hypothetical protein
MGILTKESVLNSNPGFVASGKRSRGLRVLMIDGDDDRGTTSARVLLDHER